MPAVATSLPAVSSPERFITAMHRLRPWLAGFAILVAQYSLYANIAGLTVFLVPYEGGAATSPATALSISLVGAALINCSSNGPRWVTLCMLTFALLRTSSGIMPVERLSGTMGFDTGLSIALVSLSVLLRPVAFRLAASLSFIGFLILFNSLIGRSYGLPYFAGEMAGGTMLALVFLALAGLTLFVDFKPTRVLFLSTEIGRSTRSIVLFSALVPWGCGLLLHHAAGVSSRDYPAEAIAVTLIIVAGAINAVRSGNRLERSDGKRRSAEAQLRRMAVTDSLTNLLNREGIKRHFQDWLSREREHDQLKVAVLMDIDHFKTVNDKHGHDIGDLVLQAVKPSLTPFLRSTDLIARWGGEEFLIVLDMKEFQDLPQILERLRLGMQAIPHQLAEGAQPGPNKLSASFGVAQIELVEGGLEKALTEADAALYKAKETGRNRVVFAPGLGIHERGLADGLTLIDARLPST